MLTALAQSPVSTDLPSDHYQGAFLATVVALTLAVFWAAVYERRRNRQAKERAARREVAAMPAPRLTVFPAGRHADPREAVDTGWCGRHFADTDTTTQVLTLPRLSCEPMWVGVARVPQDMGRRFAAVMRPGWWKA